MKKVTQPTSEKDIKRNWFLVDIKDRTLGREAVAIAHKLMGKSKSYFANNMDCGDYVVVINAAEFTTTGRKNELKKYTNYSGYPGGLRVRTLREVREKNPSEAVSRAVAGMLPKNKLREGMLRRLYIFNDANHPYQDKLKEN